MAARPRRGVRRDEARACWRDGWWAHARIVPSPNFGPRPPAAVVDLAVIHSISLPAGRYGGPAIEQLFTNSLDIAADPSFEGLRGLEVSAHFVIRRDGEVCQFVALQGRAWHAGVSSWRGCGNCNDWSVGIELEGLEGRRFSGVQYRRLAELLRAVDVVMPLREITGHEHIAPGRKRDPGPGFDWRRLRRELAWHPDRIPPAGPRRS